MGATGGRNNQMSGYDIFKFFSIKMNWSDPAPIITDYYHCATAEGETKY